MTATQAIRAKCIECNCGSKAEVRRCVILDCPLYPFRMGHNPNYKRKGKATTEKAASADDAPRRTD